MKRKIKVRWGERKSKTEDKKTKYGNRKFEKGLRIFLSI